MEIDIKVHIGLFSYAFILHPLSPQYNDSEVNLEPDPVHMKYIAWQRWGSNPRPKTSTWNWRLRPLGHFASLRFTNILSIRISCDINDSSQTMKYSFGRLLYFVSYPPGVIGMWYWSCVSDLAPMRTRNLIIVQMTNQPRLLKGFSPSLSPSRSICPSRFLCLFTCSELNY